MNSDKNNSDNMHINLSASGEKIKYYDYDDDTCVFEILDDNYQKDPIEMEIDAIPIDENLDLLKENEVDMNIEDLNSYCNDPILDDEDTYQCDDLESENNYYNKCKKVKGEISVVSCINCKGKNNCLEGAKINLYKLNGICPMFVRSILTDKNGSAVFSDLSEGCYRVIQIVNKNYFEKPKYIKWNEVNINKENKEAKVVVINKLKKNYNNCKYR